MIGLYKDKKPLLRAYSIASPNWHEEFEFYSIKVEDGPLTSRLQQLKEGEKIIFRKFLYDLLVFFIIVSVSLSLITWVIQSVNYLDFISKDGHGLDVYFAFIALNFPKIFSKVIIFSFVFPW